MDIALPLIQVEDRVADHLPRTMIRHIPAAIGFMQGNSGAPQCFFTHQQVLPVGVAAKGDHVRMLNEEKLIRDQAGAALLNQLLLVFRGTKPIQPAKIPNLQRIRHLSRGRRRC